MFSCRAINQHIPLAVCHHTSASQQPGTHYSALPSCPGHPPAHGVAPECTARWAGAQRDARQHQQRVRDGTRCHPAEKATPQSYHFHRGAAHGSGEEVPEAEVPLDSWQVSTKYTTKYKIFLLQPYSNPLKKFNASCFFNLICLRTNKIYDTRPCKNNRKTIKLSNTVSLFYIIMLGW